MKIDHGKAIYSDTTLFVVFLCLLAVLVWLESTKTGCGA